MADAQLGQPSRMRDVLRSRPFVVLYGAELQSVIGDQFARVALSVLVFNRTGSASATALTYAATFLPALFSGFLLGGLGDRLPRKTVLVACDLIRAGLCAAMVAPGISTFALLVLVVAAVLFGPPFVAAEVGYLAAALNPGQFRVATGLRMVSAQVAQVLGFGVGGALVAAIGERAVLAVNAGTFAVSALTIALLLPRRHAAADVAGSNAEPTGTVDAEPAAGTDTGRDSVRALLWRQPRVRGLLALSALAGLFIVPEGLAVPFARDTGASTTQAGWLLAAIPLGSVVGVWALLRTARGQSGRHGRPVRAHPDRHTWVMAVACGLPLVVSGVSPHWPLALVCWFGSGALAAYQVDVMATVAQLLPDRSRSRMISVASAVLLGAQGVGLAAAGALTRFVGASGVIALAGGLGSALAGWVGWTLSRSPTDAGGHSSPIRHGGGGRRRAQVVPVFGAGQSTLRYSGRSAAQQRDPQPGPEYSGIGHSVGQ